jgi:hypothetical protein
VCKAFTLLPLGAVIEGTAFVVHGGLFRDASVGLAEILEIDRARAITTLAPVRSPGDPQSSHVDQMERLEDMVWSDPDDGETGRQPNETRAAGILYGRDVTREFCARIGVRMVVRSHECVHNGAESWDAGEGYQVWTVFSASHYSGGSNQGAIITFSSPTEDPKVQRYDVQPLDPAELASRNHMSLVDLVIQYKHLLRKAFEQIPSAELPLELHVTTTQWAAIMREAPLWLFGINPPPLGCDPARAPPCGGEREQLGSPQPWWEVLELDIDWTTLQVSKYHILKIAHSPSAGPGHRVAWD